MIFLPVCRWGSLEYGTPRPGQVIGGRWKPLHYFLAASTFADVLVACDGIGNCYVKNDAIKPFQGTVSISSTSLATGTETSLYSKSVQLTAGAGITQWFTVANISQLDTSSVFLTATATAEGQSTPQSVNTIILNVPSELKVEKADVKFTVASSGSDAVITVTTDKPALYVTFTTLAAGRFSDNAFSLTSKRTIEFYFFGPTDMAELTRSLRVEHLATYLE